MLRSIIYKSLTKSTRSSARPFSFSLIRKQIRWHSTENKSADNLWFKNGLNFKCTGCGKCCSWEGDVWVSEDDIKSMHTYLGITRTKFMQKYVKFDVKENKFGLKAKKDEYKDIHPSEADHCIFLHNNKCVVYKAKPTQCTTYPFWPDITYSKDAWEEEKDFCEGIDRQDGQTVPISEIVDKLKRHIDNDKKIEQRSIQVDPDDFVGRRPAGVPRQSIGGVFKKIIIGFKSMNRPIFKIVALYFFSWAAYAPMMVSLTTFFQTNLYKDDEIEGLKMGLYASACFAAASFLYSLVLPAIIKGVGVKIAYLSSQVIATGCYISLFFLDSFPAEHRLVIAIVLASLVSFNYTSFNSIPFTLMSDLVASEDAGLFMGVLNSASVVAQTASVYIAAGLIAAFDQNLAYGISWGAVPSIAACICVLFLETKKQNVLEGTPLLDPEGSVNTDY